MSRQHSEQTRQRISRATKDRWEADPDRARGDRSSWSEKVSDFWTEERRLEHSQKMKLAKPVSEETGRKAREVLLLLEDGHTQSEVAQMMGITQAYVSMLKRKHQKTLQPPRRPVTLLPQLQIRCDSAHTHR